MVVKLRFNGACNTGSRTDTHKKSGHIMYKRKSQKQIDRDAQRTVNWRDNMRITRSMAQNQNMEIEHPRGGFDIGYNYNSSISGTAIPVSPVDPATDQNINNSTWSPSRPSPSNESSECYNTHIDIYPHMPLSPPQTDLYKEDTYEDCATNDGYDLQSLERTDSVEELQTGNEASETGTDMNERDKCDSNDESDGMPGCDNRICYYYHGPDSDVLLTNEQLKLYHCEKCGDVDICQNCKISGAHKRHNKHLRAMTAPPWVNQL